MTQEASLRDELGKITRERDEIELEVEAASSRLRAAGVGMDKPLVDPEGFPLANLDLASIRADRHLVVTRMNDHKALTNRAEAIVKQLLEERAKASGDGGEAAAAAAAAAETTTATATAAPSKPPPPSQQQRPAAAEALVPFAVVDDVAAASPAEEAGMRRGDRVVSFGSVKQRAPSSSSSSSSPSAPSAPAPLSRLPAEVSSALASGASIDVVVLRAGGGGGGGGGSEGGGSEGGDAAVAVSAAAAVREISLRLTPREGWGGRGALGCHLRPL